ncbi:MAK10-like protein [Tanacetum coccineum]
MLIPRTSVRGSKPTPQGFLELVDSLDLNGENRERTRLRLFQFSPRDQAGNWLKRLPAGSITTSEDLTTRFLAQFFPPGRTAKLRNDILMFQQHQGESLLEACTRFKDLLQKVPHHGIDIWLQKRLSSLRTQLGQQQDDMLSKINLLWKDVSEKLDDLPIRDTARNPTSQMNLTSTNDPTKQNRNPSSPKRVHFVNSIVILNREDEAKEEGNVKSSTTEYKDHEIIVESEEEFEEETEKEIKEEEEDSPEHFDTFPTMKELRLHYNWIMSKRLDPRRKPSNPKKIYNFVGRVKGLKVFVGKFTYKCDFMVLEDTTSVIDHDLGSVVFGKPFVEATRLVYDRKEGTIAFEKDKEKIVFNSDSNT